MPFDPAQWLDPQKLTIIGVLAAVIWLLVKEILVPKGRLDDQKALTARALELVDNQIAAMNRQTEAWEARNEAEERALRSREKGT